MSIEKICVLHQTGICLFTHEASQEESMNLEMLTSFVMALISFSQESANSEVKSTKMGNKHVYINAEEELVITLVSIGPKNQKQINKLLNSIKKEFLKEYKDFLKNGDLDQNNFTSFNSKMESLLKKYKF